MKKINKKQLGFTLFELLVSISIIAILTALATVSFSVAQKKARDSRRMEDMKTIQSAAEQFYSLSSTYSYPGSTATPWMGGGQEILSSFPVDPKGTGWTGYVYNAGTTYCACAAVENRANGNSTTNACTMGTGTTGPYFCVKSQQ